MKKLIILLMTVLCMMPEATFAAQRRMYPGEAKARLKRYEAQVKKGKAVAASPQELERLLASLPAHSRKMYREDLYELGLLGGSAATEKHTPGSVPFEKPTSVYSENEKLIKWIKNFKARLKDKLNETEFLKEHKAETLILVLQEGLKQKAAELFPKVNNDDAIKDAQEIIENMILNAYDFEPLPPKDKEEMNEGGGEQGGQENDEKEFPEPDKNKEKKEPSKDSGESIEQESKNDITLLTKYITTVAKLFKTDHAVHGVVNNDKNLKNELQKLNKMLERYQKEENKLNEDYSKELAEITKQVSNYFKYRIEFEQKSGRDWGDDNEATIAIKNAYAAAMEMNELLIEFAKDFEPTDETSTRCELYKNITNIVDTTSNWITKGQHGAWYNVYQRAYFNDTTQKETEKERVNDMRKTIIQMKKTAKVCE